MVRRILKDFKKIISLVLVLIYSSLISNCYLFGSRLHCLKKKWAEEIENFYRLRFKPISNPTVAQEDIQEIDIMLIFESIEDGHYYLFKARRENHGRDCNPLKQIIAYRFYKYFDLQTPAVYAQSLILNGKNLEGNIEIKGTMQEFIQGTRELEKEDYLYLSQDQIDYLVKCEVLDLFLRNGETLLSDFIVSQGEGKTIDKIIAIDREECFTREFHSKLRSLKETHPAYQYLWALFLEGKIDINPRVGWTFAKQIASMSDETIKELLMDLPYPELHKDLDYYLKCLLEEKKNFDKKYLEYIKILHGFSYCLNEQEVDYREKFTLKDTTRFKRLLLDEVDHFNKLRFEPIKQPTEHHKEIEEIGIRLIVHSIEEDKYYYFKINKNYNEPWHPLKQIIAYRIFKYFNLETFPTFITEVTLEGKNIERSKEIKVILQEFIKEARGLINADYFKLSQEQLDYLVKCEVLDLFLHNREVEMADFMVYEGKDGEIKNIAKIDKDKYFWERFYSHYILSKKHNYHPAYRYLWDLFKKGKINLNPQVGIDLAKRIASTPDEVFIELLSDLRQKDIEKYLSCLLEEKKNFDKKYLEYIKILHGFSIASKK